METAIKKAIDGGWLKDSNVQSNEHGHWLVMPDNSSGPFLTYKDCVLVSEFWQALGRHEGWELQWFKCGPDCGNEIRNGDWLYYMHQFIDHIAEGKSVDSFFDGILKGGISS